MTMIHTAKLLTVTVLTANFGLMAGCEPQTAGGGYHSTSSAQNVGSRSSNGLYGGTSDPTSGSVGADGANAPATPYSQKPPVATQADAPIRDSAKIGPQNP